MQSTRPRLIANLAETQGKLTIRALQRPDLDHIALWPKYPAPYEAFTPRFAAMSSHERDADFQQKQNDPSRITLAIDHSSRPAIGYLTLVEIDWTQRRIGNMGFRIAPDFCNKGIGTWALQSVVRRCGQSGIRSLRLDVAAANPRAIRCYQKAGFAIAGEFFRNEPRLKDEDLSQTRYDLVRPHVRITDGMPQVRFWWMELHPN